MKFLLIFVSPNGTTKEVTNILEKEILRDGNSVELLNLGDKNNRDREDQIAKKISESDIVGFGSPVYHMDILKPIKELLLELKKCNNYGIKAFIYNLWWNNFRKGIHKYCKSFGRLQYTCYWRG